MYTHIQSLTCQPEEGVKWGERYLVNDDNVPYRCMYVYKSDSAAPAVGIEFDVGIQVISFME